MSTMDKLRELRARQPITMQQELANASRIAGEIEAFLHARYDEQEQHVWFTEKSRWLDKPCPRCGKRITGFGKPANDAVAARTTHFGDARIGCDLTSDEWNQFAEDRISESGRHLLADLRAKRRILNEVQPYTTFDSQHLRQLMAMPFDGHRDFREEWRAPLDDPCAAVQLGS